MKKTWSILLSIVLLAMCFSVTACEEKLPTAEEVIEKLVEAQADVESYEMEGNIGVNMVLDIPEEEISMGVPMDVDAMVDIAAALDGVNQEMMMVMDIELDMAGEATMKMAIEMYLVDDWMYMMMDIPMMSPQWMKMEMSYGEFLEEMESLDFTETQVEFLKSGEVEVTGKETAEGIDCYVIEMSPDMSKLLELMMQQMQLTGGALPDMPIGELDEMIDFIDNMVKDVSATYWIAEDTFYITKGEVTFSMEITPEAMGMFEEEGSISMDVSMSMRMFNYDKPVSIVLPPEAADAVEEPMW